MTRGPVGRSVLLRHTHRAPRSISRRARAAALALLVAPAAAQTVVPVSFVEQLPVVTLTIGKTSDRFVLDTGGQATITVPTALLKKERSITQLPGTVTMTDLTGRIFHPKKIEASSVRVRSLELGPLAGLEHYEWGAGDERPRITRKGVIGLGAFQPRTIDFDLGRARLVVHDDEHAPRAPPPGAVVQALRYDADGITIEIELAGKNTSFILDSAATGSFVGSTSPALLEAPAVCFNRKERLPDCARRLTSTSGVQLSNVPMHVTEAEGNAFDGLLGVDFFRSHWIRVDFVNKTLTVAPATK